MKKLFLAVMATAFYSLLSPVSADAQDSGFGLGIILGEPTGISLKTWVRSNAAIDGAVAWSFGQNSAIHLHADYLFHDFNLFDVESGKLPLFFGIGARFKAEPEAKFGIRFPVGIAYIFEKAPLDIFLELGPVLDLAPGVSFGFTGSLGARYYF